MMPLVWMWLFVVGFAVVTEWTEDHPDWWWCGMFGVVSAVAFLAMANWGVSL